MHMRKTGNVNYVLTWQVPRIPFQSLCEWTVQWRTPSGPHSAPPGGRTGPADACGTFHCTGCLSEGKAHSRVLSVKLDREWTNDLCLMFTFRVTHQNTVYPWALTNALMYFLPCFLLFLHWLHPCFPAGSLLPSPFWCTAVSLGITNTRNTKSGPNQRKTGHLEVPHWPPELFLMQHHGHTLMSTKAQGLKVCLHKRCFS